MFIHAVVIIASVGGGGANVYCNAMYKRDMAAWDAGTRRTTDEDTFADTPPQCNAVKVPKHSLTLAQKTHA